MSERIFGTGVDIIEVERIAGSIERNARFKDHVFLKSEQEYCDGKAVPEIHYAGRFAVKEAVAKALRTGIVAQIGWRDIEVIRDPESGAPDVVLSERVRKWGAERGVTGIHISLSHTHQHAMAQAIVVGDDNSEIKENSGEMG